MGAEILNDEKGQSGMECDRENVRWREQHVQRPWDGKHWKHNQAV